MKTMALATMMAVLPVCDQATSIREKPVLQRVAHAGGGIDGQTYTNSKEAIQANIKKGFAFIEIDFVWTRDNQLVALHDWGTAAFNTFGFVPVQPPEINVFKRWVGEYSDYHNPTLEGIATLMSAHPHVVLVTDVKDRNVDALRMMARYINDFPDRVVPQIFHPMEYDAVRDIGYKNIIWTLYRFQGDDKEVLRELQSGRMKARRLMAVTMPKERADAGLGLQLQKLKVPSYVHTINTIDACSRYLLGMGINEIYTDFLSPSEYGKNCRSLN